MKKEEKVTFSLPTHVIHKDKKVYLNLNGYRNWHFFLSNQYKKNYKARVYEILDSGFLFEDKVHIEYTYYSPDKRKRDLMNVVAVVDKFFQDALVERGCIEADDTSIVKKVSVEYKGIDKTNPRIEVNLIYNL